MLSAQEMIPGVLVHVLCLPGASTRTLSGFVHKLWSYGGKKLPCRTKPKRGKKKGKKEWAMMRVGAKVLAEWGAGKKKKKKKKKKGRFGVLD